MYIIGQQIEIFIDNFSQRLNYSKQFFAHRDFTAGVFGFGCIDDQFCVFLFSLNYIDSFDSSTNCYSAVNHVDVTPF